jgi:hypothetical protein
MKTRGHRGRDRLGERLPNDFAEQEQRMGAQIAQKTAAVEHFNALRKKYGERPEVGIAGLFDLFRAVAGKATGPT